jgi:branched-chain amino acid transport system substrate-binding protein
VSRRAVTCAAIMAAVALAASGCAGALGASPDAYKIGFVSDLSGKFALNGVGQRDGFKAYFNHLNANGGINGRPVHVTYLDDGGEASRGSANVTRLGTDPELSAVGGFLLSNSCGAAAPRAESLQVPLVCSAAAPDLLEPVHPFVYGARTSQTNQALPMLDFAESVVGVERPKVAVIVFASAAGAGLSSELERLAGERGWEVVAAESVALTATDVSSQAARIVAAEPDVVVGALYDPLAILFMRTLDARGVETPFVNYEGATAAGGMIPLKDPNFYVLSNMSLAGEGDAPGVVRYREALERAGVPPTRPYANVGYLIAMEIAEGLRACGFPCSGADMQRALDGLRFDTEGFASGPVGFSPDNHEALDTVSFYVWDEQSQAVVEAASGVPAGGTTSSD